MSVHHQRERGSRYFIKYSKKALCARYRLTRGEIIDYPIELHRINRMYFR